MKIDITKPNKEKVELKHSINLEDGSVEFVGFYKKDGQFLQLVGELKGSVKVTCDITGEEFYDSLHEELFIKFVSGVYNGFDEKYDIIEVQNDIIDFDSFIIDEVEAFKLDFHRKNNDENGFTPKEI